MSESVTFLIKIWEFKTLFRKHSKRAGLRWYRKHSQTRLQISAIHLSRLHATSFREPSSQGGELYHLPSQNTSSAYSLGIFYTLLHWWLCASKFFLPCLSFWLFFLIREHCWYSTFEVPFILLFSSIKFPSSQIQVVQSIYPSVFFQLLLHRNIYTQCRVALWVNDFI